jgi:hypothetical protein
MALANTDSLDSVWKLCNVLKVLQGFSGFALRQG